jgi:hypothetical protein
MKITVLCEGRAEYYFVKFVLDPYLPADVAAVPLPVSGKAFGNVPFDMVRFAAEDELTKGDGEAPDLVTTMVDLYELIGWPSLQAASGETPLDRVHRIEFEARTSFGDDRFVPYVQLFEYESLLLSDLEELKNWLDPQGIDLLRDNLQVDLGDNWQPEDVNDGKETAPSKRIIRYAPAYEFSKKAVGPDVAKAIGIPRLRGRCKHFDEWISELEVRSCRGRS